MFIIVVDAYSKWIEVEMMSQITSAATVRQLRKIFSMHGIPRILVSDNGPAFVGKEYDDFLKRNGIRKILTAPYHPNSNGQAERSVRIFKDSMSVLQEGCIDTRLSRLLFKYRITPHSRTGKTPAELLFNRKLRSAFSMIRPGKSRQEEVIVSSSNGEERKGRSFKESDDVWVKNFGKGEKWLPGVISKILGRVNYEVKMDGSSDVLHRHVDHICKRMEKEAWVADGRVILNDGLGKEDDVETVVLEDREFVIAGTEDGGDRQVDRTLDQMDGEIDQGVVGDGLDGNVRRSSRVLTKPAWLKDFVC